MTRLLPAATCVLLALAAIAAATPVQVSYAVDDAVANLTVTDPNVHLLTFTGDAKGQLIGFTYGLVDSVPLFVTPCCCIYK